MNNSAYFRALARNALTGRWALAVGTGFVASLLGAVSYGSGSFNISNGDEISNSLENLSPQLLTGITIILVIALVSIIIYAIMSLFLGSIVWVGYSKFNLDLYDWLETPEFNTLFKFMGIWKTAVVANLLQGLYILLWSLLFIIPGIIAAYDYAMTNYILAEHPNLTASQALEMSKTIMNGNRWRLFCLRFSFIGWHLLAALSLGIGELWVLPYEQAAIAAFYKEISSNCYEPQAA